MFLKEVTLQGFKSYANRTVVGPFDSHFNALTGLNGSGKSNVLDGICFALGLTTLSHVRANSLQDLVYQQGQSGIRTAVVSLTFDNSDKSRSPREYTHCDEINVTREIVIQGRNKLRINGRNADHKEVEALFQSVGMNINNPHFVIMQGKITQVLNMKPLRILALLEEAAGTSVYDKRKASTKQKLVDNEAKVDELDKVTRNDLLPKMQTQREERTQYREYNNLQSQYEGLQRFCIAYEFSNCQSIIQQCSDGNTGVHQELAELDRQTNSFESELMATNTQMENVSQEKEKRGGRALRKAEDSLHNLEKRLVEERANLVNSMELKEGQEVEKSQIQSDLDELSEEVHNQRVEDSRKKHEHLEQTVVELEQVIRAAECDLASAKDGIPRDEEGRTLPERLDLARSQEAAAKGDADAVSVRVSALEKDWSSLKQSLEPRLIEAREQEDSLLNFKQKIQHLESQLKSLDVDPSAVSHLEERIAHQQENIRRSRAAFEYECESSGLQVPFQDPYPGFNRKESVKGVLARLFTVKDPQHALALEVAMGGRLRNLVVDTAHNASQILKNGKLKRRTTIAPLDQIQSKSIDRHAREAVQRVAGDDAIPAIDLISYAPEVSRAMEYACGTTFVCKDSSIGSQLSRDLKGLRFVTLAGQDFSTDGTFSDGFRDPKASILNRVQRLQDMEAELMAQLAELTGAQEQIQSMGPRAKEHEKLSKELDAQLHNLSLHEKHHHTSSIQQDMRICAQLESDLQSARAMHQAAHNKVEKLIRLQQDLQRQISTLGTSQHAFVQETQLKLQASKEKLAVIEPEAREASMVYKAITAEGFGAVKEREKIQRKLLAADEQWKALVLEVEAHQQAIGDLEAKFKEQEAAVQEMQQGLVDCGKQANVLINKKQALEASLSQMSIKRQDVQSRLSDVAREEQRCLSRKDKLLKDYPWIAAHRNNFGVAGTDFDWLNNNPKSKIKDYDNVKKRIEELKPKINKNIAAEYDATKEEMYMLEKRRLQLQGDKKKILKMMHKLDDQKASRIEETWLKVKDKLGEIFRTLLPGADATLQPLAGHPILDGLEIKVALGGEWKESLTDLSGGQRSLCALALILALLVFSPAPVYILDEVDAALDLSHTQNMGVMIRKFFPQSQFLIVSLKEGMFSNANVIFRTKLVQGKSCINRSVGQK